MTSWVKRSGLISEFCVAARTGGSREELANIFKNAVTTYQSEVEGIDLEQGIVDVVREIKSRTDQSSIMPIDTLNDVFNWISENPHYLSIPTEKVEPVAAADGVSAGLQKLGFEPSLSRVA